MAGYECSSYRYEINKSCFCVLGFQGYELTLQGASVSCCSHFCSELTCGFIQGIVGFVSRAVGEIISHLSLMGGGYDW